MLSLQKTTAKDILLAHIYPDAESKVAAASIWYTPKFQGAPQLQNDDIGTLLLQASSIKTLRAACVRARTKV